MRTVKIVLCGLATLGICNAYAAPEFYVLSNEKEIIKLPEQLAEHSEYLKNGLRYKGKENIVDCSVCSYNELILLVEMLGAIDHEILVVAKECRTIDFRRIYDIICSLRWRFDISIERFIFIIKYFGVTVLNDTILDQGLLPVLPAERVIGTKKYDEVVLALFFLLNNPPVEPKYYALLGKMLYPGIQTKEYFKFMFWDIAKHPEVEEAVRYSYIQQHPELFQVKKNPLKIKHWNDNVDFIFFNQGICIVNDKTVTLYNTQFEILSEFALNSSCGIFTLSPDGRMFVTSSYSANHRAGSTGIPRLGAINLLDCNNGNFLCELLPQLSDYCKYHSCTFSPDNAKLAVKKTTALFVHERKSFLSLLDVKTRKVLKEWTFEDIEGVTFSPDGSKFAFVGIKNCGACCEPIRYSDGACHNHRWFIPLGVRSIIFVVNTVDGEVVNQFEYVGPVSRLAIALDPMGIPTVVDGCGIVHFGPGQQGGVRTPFLYPSYNDVSMPKRIGSFHISYHHDVPFRSIVFSPNQDIIAALIDGWDKVEFYSVETGMELVAFHPNIETEKQLITFPVYFPISRIGFSANGQHLALINGVQKDPSATTIPDSILICPFNVTKMRSLKDILNIHIEKQQ